MVQPAPVLPNPGVADGKEFDPKNPSISLFLLVPPQQGDGSP